MKTEVEYWRDMASKAVMALRTAYEGAFGMFDSDEESIDRKARDKMMSELEIEDVEEYEELLANDPSGAYGIYLANEEREHNFEVSFSVNASGRVTVRAKTEDDAEEYVENNLEVEDNSDGVNVYMCDDGYVTEDIEVDNSSWSIDDVYDNGEVEDD